jgi:hypothetical protein
MSCLCALLPACVLQHVQAQFSSSKKEYLKEQMKTQLDPAKLGLTKEVRELVVAK